MRGLSLLICIFISHYATSQSFQKIHRKAIFIDTHNDILTQNIEKGVIIDTDLKGKTHSDLNRWKQGGLDAQLFSVWCDGDKKEPYQYANRQLDTLDAVVNRNPDKIVKVANSRQLSKIVRQHKIAAMAGVEGGHMIEDDINKLDSLYNRGVRYMTLTWNNSTSWATSAFDETFKKDLTQKGLTGLGKQVVQRMNKLGMIVDISHVGEKTFADVIQTTNKPIIASHSSVYALCPHQRNLKDDQIRAIAKNGGVIQINFYSGFLDSNFMKKKTEFLGKHKAEWDSLRQSGKPEYLADDYIASRYAEEAASLHAPFDLLIQHIEYIIKLVGADYVGIGSDFDGIEAPPKQLDDVTTYPLITKALVERGYTKRDINKILGGNFLRVLKANQKNVQ
ncbi:dipeptidase [Flavitalea sp.]|nr:dipeptidase [Flavitalea sp.]